MHHCLGANPLLVRILRLRVEVRLPGDEWPGLADRYGSAPIIKVVLHPTGREGRHVDLLGLLDHVFAHTDELLDKELKHGILVTCF